MANEADETPEEIVEHLAELGFHSQDDDPQDDGLDDVLEDAPTTPPNYYGDHPGCKITFHWWLRYVHLTSNHAPTTDDFGPRKPANPQ